ncbi:MAG TPA: ATPase domain-containing protein [Thermoplasmata archaeon]
MAKVVPTGIAALDKALMSGMPRGFTLLVTGPPGAGTELVAKQFAATGVRDENVVYFTTTERDEDVTATMEDFGWKSDITIVNIGNLYYESVLAKKLEVSRNREEGISVKDLKAAPTNDARRTTINFLTTLTYEFSKLKPPFRAVVDSLDFFFEYYPHADVLSALRTIKAHTQHEEGVALLTMLSGVYDTRTQSGVEEIVDGIVELERVRHENEFRRILVLRKVRNHPEKTGLYEYSITDEGITAR